MSYLRPRITTKSTAIDYTLEQYYDVVEVDATSANVIVTLPVITAAFQKDLPILIKRIDDSLFTLTINGTGGNYEDDGIPLYGLQGATIYASDDANWRSVS